jgi:hypothetical protein
VCVPLILLFQATSGEVAVARLWGFGILGISLILLVRTRIPVYAGRRRVGTLIGWRKVYVLAPAFAIGLAVAAFPEHAVQALAYINRLG